MIPWPVYSWVCCLITYSIGAQISLLFSVHWRLKIWDKHSAAQYLLHFKAAGSVLHYNLWFVAFRFFGDKLPQSDLAYPTLITTVIPTWLLGLMAAVLFGCDSFLV